MPHLLLAAEVAQARSQMGLTLAFHIVLACFGVAFPAVVMIAHYRGLTRNDADALLLARRWSKVMAVLVAVGAVSGTLLSFEMGLLWPGLMGRFGGAIGIPFSIEGIFFLLEAIFVSIYLYGWQRLPRWAHFWCLAPVAVSGIFGAWAVVAANSWMNQPAGYTLVDGRVLRINPFAVFFNRAVMSTLFAPLSLAAFGIILRGCGFVFRHTARSLRVQRLSGAVFALSSLITPFFLGAAAGAIVTGRVPAHGTGAPIASWTTPTAIVLGGLSIAAFAYLAAVYLARDAHRTDPSLVDYFGRRAMLAGAVVGALAGLALYELEGSAPRIATRLTTGPGLPLLVVSFVLGTAALVALILERTRWVRFLGAGAFAAILWGWAVAQYPDLLPGSLTLRAGAAPHASLVAVLAVVGVIAALVAPSFALLYRLTQHGLLAEEDSTAAFAAALQTEGSGSPDP